MDTIGLSRDIQHSVFSLLAGILHLGNVQFGDKDNYATVLSERGRHRRCLRTQHASATFHRSASAMRVLRHSNRGLEKEADLETIGIQGASREQASRSDLHRRQGHLHPRRPVEVDLFAYFRLSHSSTTTLLGQRTLGTSLSPVDDQRGLSNSGSMRSFHRHSRHLWF